MTPVMLIGWTLAAIGTSLTFSISFLDYFLSGFRNDASAEAIWVSFISAGGFQVLMT